MHRLFIIIFRRGARDARYFNNFCSFSFSQFTKRGWRRNFVFCLSFSNIPSYIAGLAKRTRSFKHVLIIFIFVIYYFLFLLTLSPCHLLSHTYTTTFTLIHAFTHSPPIFLIIIIVIKFSHSLSLTNYNRRSCTHQSHVPSSLNIVSIAFPKLHQLRAVL